MKKIHIFMLALAIFSCNTEKKGTSYAEVKISDIEDFPSFFKKFQTNSLFQAERIENPIIIETIDDESDGINYIKSTKKIDYVSFEQKNWNEKISISTKVQTNDTVVVEINGTETGLSVELYFAYKDNRWYLCKIRDNSN